MLLTGLLCSINHYNYCNYCKYYCTFNLNGFPTLHYPHNRQQ